MTTKAAKRKQRAQATQAPNSAEGVAANGRPLTLAEARARRDAQADSVRIEIAAAARCEARGETPIDGAQLLDLLERAGMQDSDYYALIDAERARIRARDSLSGTMDAFVGHWATKAERQRTACDLVAGTMELEAANRRMETASRRSANSLQAIEDSRSLLMESLSDNAPAELLEAAEAAREAEKAAGERRRELFDAQKTLRNTRMYFAKSSRDPVTPESATAGAVMGLIERAVGDGQEARGDDADASNAGHGDGELRGVVDRAREAISADQELVADRSAKLTEAVDRVHAAALAHDRAVTAAALAWARHDTMLASFAE